MNADELRALRYEVADRVALVTLNRPDRLNAWTVHMEREYQWALGAAEADPEVRVVVVTGAGRGFCAGADFRALDQIVERREYGSGDGEPAARYRHSFPLSLSKPLIAAVNGPAAGVGFVLMCFADIRFAAAGAKLTTSFARLGLPAEHGVSWMLSRLVGPARAADLLFSSRVVLAEEAAELGLVNRVLPGDELLEFALDYARTVAAETAPSSLAAMKAQLRADLDGDLESSVSRAQDLLEDMVKSDDFAEGVRAAQERRPPKFG